MKSVMSVSTARPYPSGSGGAGQAEGAEGSRACGYLWAATEMVLRMLTNGMSGAPPTTCLSLVYHMAVVHIEGILQTLTFVLSPISYDRDQTGHKGSMAVSAPHRS